MRGYFGEVQAWNVLADMDAGGHEILTAEKLPARLRRARLRPPWPGSGC